MPQNSAKGSGRALLALVLAGALSGCYCPPPFDFAGTYNGYWEGAIYEQIGDNTVYRCPFSLTLRKSGLLFHLAGLNVAGTASFNYTCFLEEDLAQWVNYNAIEVPIWGRTQRDGTFLLASGACLNQDAVCLEVRLEGRGEDRNGDRRMDIYNGDMRFCFALPVIEPIDVAMAFETDAADWRFKAEKKHAALPLPTDTPPASSPH